ncbi:MAG: DUF2178 domain-containing protein [Clostridia bacterium]|nr:DUF2178 domain-containing protein [Clostridia bacterium]
MDYAKKLKIRLYVAFAMIGIGIALILTGIFGGPEMASSFGTVFMVVGIARIVQHRRITKDPERLRRREIAEQDERNIMLWTKARSLALSVYTIGAGLAVVVLYLMNMGEAANIVAWCLMGFMVIYWVCYFIISRKF